MMKLQALPINWFDLIVLAVLIVGVIVGRKRGLSEEMLDLVQWLGIVVVCALYYEPIGRFVAVYTSATLLVSFIATYLFLALLIRLFFGWLKRRVGEKLVESDVFGNFEYYLGMLAGAVRYACILVVVMALVHSRRISPEQLAAQAKMQRENFGTISFPTFGLLQQAMFDQSVSGRFVKKYLAEQLIAATPADQRVIQREGIGARRQRAVEETMGLKN